MLQVVPNLVNRVLNARGEWESRLDEVNDVVPFLGQVTGQDLPILLLEVFDKLKESGQSRDTYLVRLGQRASTQLIGQLYDLRVQGLFIKRLSNEGLELLLGHWKGKPRENLAFIRAALFLLFVVFGGSSRACGLLALLLLLGWVGRLGLARFLKDRLWLRDWLSLGLLGLCLRLFSELSVFGLLGLLLFFWRVFLCGLCVTLELLGGRSCFLCGFLGSDGFSLSLLFFWGDVGLLGLFSCSFRSLFFFLLSGFLCLLLLFASLSLLVGLGGARFG